MNNGTVIAEAIWTPINMEILPNRDGRLSDDREEMSSGSESFSSVLGQLSDAPEFAAEGYLFINTYLPDRRQTERLDMFANLG